MKASRTPVQRAGHSTACIITASAHGLHTVHVETPVKQQAAFVIKCQLPFAEANIPSFNSGCFLYWPISVSRHHKSVFFINVTHLLVIWPIIFTVLGAAQVLKKIMISN